MTDDPVALDVCVGAELQHSMQPLMFKAAAASFGGQRLMRACAELIFLTSSSVKATARHATEIRGDGSLLPEERRRGKVGLLSAALGPNFPSRSLFS